MSQETKKNVGTGKKRVNPASDHGGAISLTDQ